MIDEHLRKIDTCRHLLPDPGPKVVGELVYECWQAREENKAQAETLKVMNDALKEAHRIFGKLGHSPVVKAFCPDFAEVAELVRKSHDQHA